MAWRWRALSGSVPTRTPRPPDRAPRAPPDRWASPRTHESYRRPGKGDNTDNGEREHGRNDQHQHRQDHPPASGVWGWLAVGAVAATVSTTLPAW